MTDMETIKDYHSELLDITGTLYRYECTEFEKSRIDKLFPKLIDELSALFEEGCVLRA